MEGSFG
jgi:hypothetical protein